MRASLTPIADIQALVAEHYDLPPRVMRSREMSRPAPEARQVAMYLAHRQFGKNCSEIGRRFDRDHTTVIHAIKVVKQRMANDEAYARDVEVLQAKVAA